MEEKTLGNRTFLVPAEQTWHICYNAEANATAIMYCLNTRRRFLALRGNHLEAYRGLVEQGLDAVIEYYRQIELQELNNKDWEKGVRNGD